MPPRTYPKLPGADGSAVRRARKGYVTVEQLKLALNGTVKLFDRAALKVTYYCALRASETGLQPVEAFDARRGTLDVVRLKGSLSHTYLLEPWVLVDLKSWLARRPKDSRYLFPHPLDPSAALDRFNMRHIWVRAAKRAGLAKELHHPHVLKHSVATHMLERGDDILFVQAWLGHKRLENTQVYAELTGKRLSEGQMVMKNLMQDLEKK